MTGLARIGEEVEDQFELWALINREKHFGGERGLDGERKWGREGGREKKMTLVCCKEFLNLRVVRTSATIWSISNPWATFALMKLKQDGVKGGRGGRVMRQGVGCMPRSSEGPKTKKRQESVWAVKKQSLWVHKELTTQIFVAVAL